MARTFLVFLTVVAALGLGPRATAAMQTPFERELTRLISESGPLELDDGTVPLDQARRFYEARGGAPAWLTPQGWSERAGMAVEWLRAAGRDGLRPRDYPAALQPLPGPVTQPALLARAELLLSVSLLRYVADVQMGRRAPGDIDPDLRVSPRQVDAVLVLSAGLAESDFPAWLAALPPAGPEYLALRDALARYRSLAAGTAWPVLADGPKLELGTRDPRVVTLRRQLALLGDLAAGPSSDDTFDKALEAAVQAFQDRHGLDSDGVVGPATRRAVNRSPADWALQIELNMERLRWLAENLGERHVLVNIADFRLTAVAEGRSLFSTPVVVGRDYRRTPVFSDRMINLVLSPTWTVPPRIARLDLLPKVKGEPEFLRQKGFRVYSGWGPAATELDPQSIDWTAISPQGLGFKFRQDPGPLNALGGVRFSLTNDFNIYLHDTPDRNLFSRSKRSFSSGCIRVQEVMALALFALDGDPSWPETRLREAMESGRTQVVKLAKPLPVHITYMTAWVDGSGRLQFREDVYRRDQLLAEKLGLVGG